MICVALGPEGVPYLSVARNCFMFQKCCYCLEGIDPHRRLVTIIISTLAGGQKVGVSASSQHFYFVDLP